MNLKITILIMLILILFSKIIKSQDCSDVTIIEAKKHYEIGNFEGVINMLQPCIGSTKIFSERQFTEANRLLSLSYFALDSIIQAETIVNRILKIDASFSATIYDPPKYIEMVNALKIKGLSSQISSVSKKLENLHEAPATVMVITEEDVINRGYIDLEALFSDLPGFDVTRTYGPSYSNIYQRGYRSNNTDRTLFLVDGIEQNDLWSNISYWSRQFPITNVKRIEIIYGPASTMYGANALVGVVNVITKEIDEFKDNKNYSISANCGIGTYNTKYTDITAAAKVKDIAASFTFRYLRSDEMDLSKYDEYNYDPSDYDNVDYQGLLSVYSGANTFIRDNNIDSTNQFFSILKNPNGDTIGAVLTDKGAEAAKNYDKEALKKKLNNNSIEYSNISDQLYYNAKIKISDFTLSYEWWRYIQGGTNYYNDNNEAGSDNGSLWVPKQSFFYAKYDKELSKKLSLMNLAQYRITQVDDRSKAVYLFNYSNYGLAATDLLYETEPFWVNENYYQISRQFRDELKVNYNPFKRLNIVSGVEVRNSSIQGDYRKISYIDSLRVYPDVYMDTDPTDSSVIEIGGSSGDKLKGGNDFTVYDMGVYAQATFKPYQGFTLVGGGRYDYNKIRVTGGYGEVFNPRLALIYNYKDFYFKGIYASAFQNASNWTKYSTNTSRKVNNPTLPPEKVNNIEFSILYRQSEKLTADVVYFNSTYTGVVGTKIVSYEENGTTVSTGQNDAIGRMKIDGIQSTVNYKAKEISFYANYTYTNPMTEVIDKLGNQTGEYIRIGDISTHKINCGFNYEYKKKLNTNLRVNYMSERLTGDNTSIASNPGSFPAVVLLNGAISYKIYKGIDIQFICNNILNKEYFDPGVRSADGVLYAYRTPQRERNYMIRMIYNL
ncbi:MAG: hypothetical protein A2X12_04845 [Bacteroidetes bacterium GWE2_29_8]|nr:MAG: hypothetical protein A2X12_04845 [Bacteroidetes bacterium GWE2_29_8]OFY24598.1 MAG: hypothetical protein A2X02_03290 [Bacteroidetes bacterium GWF2_29_10]